MEKEILKEVAIKSVPRWFIGIILVMAMWLDSKFALYMLVTLSLFGVEVFSFYMEATNKAKRKMMEEV